jgi:pyruvate dehydrogenase (quinone)
VRHLTDRAVRIAIAERRVTALIFPNDLQDLKYEEPPRAHGTLHSGVRRRKSSPTSGSCARPPTCWTPVRKSRSLVGAGALKATDEVIQVADRLGAGVAKALLGKAALPDDLPWVTGS